MAESGTELSVHVRPSVRPSLVRRRRVAVAPAARGRGGAAVAVGGGQLLLLALVSLVPGTTWARVHGMSHYFSPNWDIAEMDIRTFSSMCVKLIRTHLSKYRMLLRMCHESSLRQTGRPSVFVKPEAGSCTHP